MPARVIPVANRARIAASDPTGSASSSAFAAAPASIDATVTPRGLSREQGATYVGCSVDMIDRLIHAGILPIIKLPVRRSRANTSEGVPGANRRILIDVKDLDALIERSKEVLS